NARCARNLVGGIATQGDEIRDLCGVDPIPCANLSGVYPRDFACAEGIKDCGVVRCELERVAVATRNEDSTPTLLFRRSGGSEKIIHLKAPRLLLLKTASSNKLPQPVKLLYEPIVKFATSLISWKLLMPVGRDL